MQLNISLSLSISMVQLQVAATDEPSLVFLNKHTLHTVHCEEKK